MQNAKNEFSHQNRLEILNSFGYIIVERQPYVVATIVDDPEAFMVVCHSQEEAQKEAYQFLFNEVDPELHELPEPKSFQ